MTVRIDDGRSVRFDLKDCDRIDHGYVATTHKVQGTTVDRVRMCRRHRAWMPKRRGIAFRAGGVTKIMQDRAGTAAKCG